MVGGASTIRTDYPVARFKLGKRFERALAALRAWDGDLHVGHGAVSDVEITPEMIQAGIRELALCESWDSRRSVVLSVYQAMQRQRLQQPVDSQ